jgi:hypothetical protein
MKKKTKGQAKIYKALHGKLKIKSNTVENGSDTFVT